MAKLERMLSLVRRHRPDLEIVDKRTVPWVRGLGLVLRPVIPDFMTAFTMVIGDRVYLAGSPDRFPRDQLARILAHELVHQLDQAKHGAAFYLSYALLPLPLLRTRRAHWERRAYAVDLMLDHHDGGEEALLRTLQRCTALFAGPAYGWMWAGEHAASTFLEDVAAEVRSGALAQRDPYREILEAWRGPEAS
ncbi:MAG TPA: hypothetical protein ENK18_00045 [Deltaproteobacteria bacterium]|nr:hypothetical protein [Deltaproteobacteria bacterium]